MANQTNLSSLTEDELMEMLVRKEGIPFYGVLQLIDLMPFRRKCWNENERIVYQKGYPDGISCNEQTAKAWNLEVGSPFKCAPYLQFQKNDGMHYMWSPSNEDLFATDWVRAD